MHSYNNEILSVNLILRTERFTYWTIAVSSETILLPSASINISLIGSFSLQRSLIHASTTSVEWREGAIVTTSLLLCAWFETAGSRRPCWRRCSSTTKPPMKYTFTLSLILFNFHPRTQGLRRSRCRRWWRWKRRFSRRIVGECSI